MHRLSLSSVIAVCLVGAPLTAQSPEPSSPFGLPMGASQAQVFRLVGKSPDRDGTITTKVVPRPDAAFETYNLRVSPALGLCRVSGIGRNIPINATGSRLKSAFATILGELTGRYGPPSGTLDRLSPGSQFDEPDEWTLSLLREERTLMAYWDPPANASDLSGVSIRAMALNRTTGYLVVAYEAKDYKLCRDEAQQKSKAPR